MGCVLVQRKTCVWASQVLESGSSHSFKLDAWLKFYLDHTISVIVGRQSLFVKNT